MSFPSLSPAPHHDPGQCSTGRASRDIAGHAPHPDRRQHAAGFSTTYALQLAASAPGSTIEGLDHRQLSQGSRNPRRDAADVQVLGNYIGCRRQTGPRTLGGERCWISITSAGNTVGGTRPAARNVISGYGVAVFLTGGSNIVEGNYLGTNLTGTAALSTNQQLFGVLIERGIGNTIGGTTAGAERDLGQLHHQRRRL